MVMKKILFLDFDGVLVTDRYQEQLTVSKSPLRDFYGTKFDPVCVECLRQIVDKTGADIVVTSTWKMDKGLNGIQKMWETRFLPGKVIGITPDIDLVHRGDEIDAWLAEYKADCRYAIIDDCPILDFFNERQQKFLFKVDEQTGLDESTMLKVVEYLNCKDLKCKKQNKIMERTNSRQNNGMENIFHVSDKLRYYQVKDGCRYQILVQEKSDEIGTSILPYHYDGSSQSVPVCPDHKWCLDRCVGIIDVINKDSIFVNSDDEIVELEASFRKKVSVREGFPDGEIVVGKIRKNVDILLPLSNPSDEMKKIVGCEDIKRRLLEFKSLAEYNKACLRQSPDYAVMEIFLHSVFYGNPGTGKTTICRLYGSLLKEAGLLSKGHVVVADRNTLACEYFGETEQIVEQLVNMSKGGVLMFDEAYLLEGSHRDDPNKMVLPQLLPILADEHNKDFAVVICGYKDKLDQMINHNPGLYSRFTNRFEFKDYTLDELVEIGVRYLATFGHSFTIDGMASFREELASAMSGSSKKSWANARSVKNMIEQIYIKRAMRYGKDGTLDREISSEDITGIPYERSHKIGF